MNDTLDPAKQSNQTDYCRGFMFYNGLTVLDGSLTPRPQLAEEFTTQDAKTWVFKLRKDVTFHDGKPLTPADVVFSIMRHKDAATASRAKVLADQIESVTASGPNEVTFRLSSPNADLPVILGTYHFHIVKAGTTDFNAGIGTGPYKVKEFKPGVRSIAVRNENYWKPNRPYLDEIELVGITDESARVNALLAGQLDLIQAVSPRSVDRVTATRQARGLRDQVGVVHRPDHAARQQPGQQPGLRAGHEVPVQPRADAQVDPARPRGGGQRPAHRPEQPLLLQGPAAAPVRPREGEVASAEGQPGQRRRSRWWPRPPRPTRWRWPW